MALSFQMEEPMEALVHAICSVRPQPYYFVDSPTGTFLREIGRHANIEVTDAFIGGAKHFAYLKKRFSTTK